MTRDPDRRWFRFSLRTLFILITVVACWLGSEFNWIRQRHALLEKQARLSEKVAAWDAARLEQQQADGSGTFTYLVTGVATIQVLKPKTAPGLLWLFGEEGSYFLSLIVIEQDPEHPVDKALEKQKASRLFPEATIINVRIVRDAPELLGEPPRP